MFIFSHVLSHKNINLRKLFLFDKLFGNKDKFYRALRQFTKYLRPYITFIAEHVCPYFEKHTYTSNRAI